MNYFNNKTESCGTEIKVILIIADPLLPHFPAIVENVTISHGRKAVLKCQVENLRNYKVTPHLVEYRSNTDRIFSELQGYPSHGWEN